ncbi:hypothetical protein Vi05172_g8916 [Venturia inaequalis]|nr:hypothetical protein Vi05172_g8916 [Venturia inaequalis]
MTPITPVHSPHPSNGSSIRSRTPGQLSLHEYRKQQVTPSPPALQGQRSVKKKRAATSLNKREVMAAELERPELYQTFHTLSTPPLTPSLITPNNFTSHHSLLNASATRYGPVIPEFSHLTFAPPPHQHTQQNSFESEDAPLLDRSGSSRSLFPHLLPPSTPPHLEDSTPHFLSSFFPLTRTAPQPAQSGYHALGGDSLDEESRSTERLVLHSSSPGSGKPSRIESKHTSGPSKDFRPHLSDQQVAEGGRAPWYVLNSARLPGIGKAERGFEDEQAVKLLQNDSDASFPAQHSNLFKQVDLANTNFQQRFQLLEQQGASDSQPRECHFKATKRLPHPETEPGTKKRPSPLNFSAYRGKPLAPPASVQTSSTSTLSLSNFNFPQPPVATRFSARRKHFAFGLQENLPPRTSTPTIIQHRGVSFELVNPHDSLRQTDIRTPLEIEDSDFFSGPLRPSLAPSIMEDSADKSAEKQKPQAQLYTTIREALTGIRKEKAPNEQALRKSERRQSKIKILDSVNVDYVTGRNLTAEQRTERVLGFQKQVHEASRPSTPSLLYHKAASSIASAAGSIKRHSFSDGEKSPKPPKAKRSASNLLRSFRTRPGSGLDGADEFDEDDQDYEDCQDSEDDEYEDYDDEEQGAEAGATEDGLHSYAESDYAHSLYAGSVVDTRRSVPFGVLTGETDYSEFSMLDQHRFSATSQASAGVQFTANPSTLSEIIHGYENNRSSGVQRLELQAEQQDDSGNESQSELQIHPKALMEVFEPRPVSPPRAQQSVGANPFNDNDSDVESGPRIYDEFLSREISGLSDDILEQLSPGGENTDENTSSTVSRPAQAPSAPPSYGLPPLPANAPRPLRLFSNRDLTPSSSEVASQFQSYGDTRQLLMTPSSATVGAHHRPNDSFPTRTDRPPVTAQDFPLQSEEDGDQFTIETPAKKLRCMNPDPLSVDSKGSIQCTPPPAEGANPFSGDTESDSSDHHMSPLTRFSCNARKGFTDITGRTVEDFRNNPFSGFDGSYSSTSDRRHGVPREHPFLNPDAVDRPIASRTSNVDDGFSSAGSIADISDASNLSDMDQTEDEIAAIMEEGDHGDWGPRNRDSLADDWTTVREPSQTSLPVSVVESSSSMAEYSHTPPGRLYQNQAFRSGATITPSPTFSIPLAQAHVFGHSGHIHYSQSPEGSYALVEQNVGYGHNRPNGNHYSPGARSRQVLGYPAYQSLPHVGLAGNRGPSSIPATFTSHQVQSQLQAAQNYIVIPNNMLSAEPDDSPAQIDEPFDHSPLHRSPMSSPPTYASQEARPAQPNRPEPVYYSPTRNIQQRGRPMLDLEAQDGIELQEISGQRTYRQHNGSQIARASVASQRTLQPLALQATLQPPPTFGANQQPATGSNQSLETDNTHWSWFQHMANRFSANHPDAPKDDANVRKRDGMTLPRHNEPMTAAELRRASTMSELQQSRLPSHSVTADRRRIVQERRTALICLLFIGWFPPFALLLGYDFLNPLVHAVSNGEIERLPDAWKVVASRAGWVQMAGYLVLLVIILCYHATHLE